jgi:hypothetical protein
MNFQNDSLDQYIVNNLFSKNSFEKYFQNLKKLTNEDLNKKNFDFKVSKNVENP